MVSSGVLGSSDSPLPRRQSFTHCSSLSTLLSISSGVSLCSSTMMSSAYEDRASSRTVCIISASLFSWILLRAYPLETSMALVSYIQKQWNGQYLPLFEPFPQFGMVTPDDDDKVYPSFREDLARMPVDDLSSASYLRFKLIEQLRFRDISSDEYAKHTCRKSLLSSAFLETSTPRRLS